MKRQLCQGVAALLIAAAPLAAAAQAPPPAAPAAAARPTPHLPNGKPDFNGFWNGRQMAFGGAPGPEASGEIYLGFVTRDGTYDAFEDDVTVMGRGLQNKPVYKPEYWDKVRELDWNNGREVDPNFHCYNSFPRLNQTPTVIMQNASHLAMIYEDGNDRRLIAIDGRPPNEERLTDQTWWGYSLGHWEGETLVIVSTGFNDLSWFSSQGYIHSNEMKVTERLTRQGEELHYVVIVEDPMLLEPWKMTDRQLHLNVDPKAEIWEADPCDERDDKATDAAPEVGR